MSNEEFQRKRDFIVRQQAQFASDMQVLRESQAQTDQVVARLAYELAQSNERFKAKMARLNEAQARRDQKQSEGRNGR